jgi:hypothetical protein
VRSGKEEELGSTSDEELDGASDEELGGGYRQRPFSFFTDPCSSGKNSESMDVDVSIDALDLVRTC